MMLTRHDDGKFWMVRYIERTDQVEIDQVFRIEHLVRY